MLRVRCVSFELSFRLRLPFPEAPIHIFRSVKSLIKVKAPFHHGMFPTSRGNQRQTKLLLYLCFGRGTQRSCHRALHIEVG